MMYTKAVPHKKGPPFVYVYSVSEEHSDENHPSCGTKVAYGVLLEHREQAPEWMHSAITMLDMAQTGENQLHYSDHGVPGVGYKGSIWYVIYDDPKYAEEAGIDVSDLIDT